MLKYEMQYAKGFAITYLRYGERHRIGCAAVIMESYRYFGYWEYGRYIKSLC